MGNPSLTWSTRFARNQQWYRPGAVFLQAGTDSLAGDRLGCFNLSHIGHGKCLEFMKKFNVPILLTGGGGYTPKNVSRTWCYETSLALDVDLPVELPYNNYFEYFGPNYRLEVLRGYKERSELLLSISLMLLRRSFPATNMPNMNTPEYLRKVRETVLAHLKELAHAPSVQMQQVPVDHFSDEDVEDEDKYKDERITQRDRDSRVVRPNEYEDSDDEGGKGPRKGNKVYQSYRDPAAAPQGAKPAQQVAHRSMMGGYKPVSATSPPVKKAKPIAEEKLPRPAPASVESANDSAEAATPAGDGDVEMAD